MENKHIKTKMQGNTINMPPTILSIVLLENLIKQSKKKTDLNVNMLKKIKKKVIKIAIKHP